MTKINTSDYTVENILKLMDTVESTPLDDVPEEVYHELPAMSASGLREFRKGPGYFKWWMQNQSQQKDTAARLEGRLVHMAIGEPKRFENEVAIVDGHRGSKDVKAEIQLAESIGKTVIKKAQYDMAVGIAEHCRKHELISSILKSGTAERTFLWKEKTTGGHTVLCKARIDWMTPNDVLVDWKTFDHVWNDDLLEYQVRTMGYQNQDEWYQRGYRAVFGRKPKAFYSAFLRNSEPFDVAVREIGEKSLTDAKAKIDLLLNHYAECLEEDLWPMTPPTVGEINVKVFS